METVPCPWCVRRHSDTGEATPALSKNLQAAEDNSAEREAATELNFTIAVPSWQVEYVPSVLQRLQFAWVNYLALLIPLYWVLSWSWGVAVRQAVVVTRAHNPLKAHRR